MTRTDLFNELKSNCDSVIYAGNEGELKTLPFIVYCLPENNVFHADNTHYFSAAVGWVEIYTRQADFLLEKKVVNVFKRLDICYKKENETYIDGEKMFLCRYGIEFIEEEN